MLLIIVAVALLMPILSGNVSAQNQASLADKLAGKTSSWVAKAKTYTYTSASTDNVTLTKAEILRQRGVPGKGIDTAPGLQKPFNPKSKAAMHAGKKDKPMKWQFRTRLRAENHP